MKTTPVHKVMLMLVASCGLVAAVSTVIAGQETEFSKDVRGGVTVWMVGYFICMAIDRLADEVTLIREMKRDR